MPSPSLFRRPAPAHARQRPPVPGATLLASRLTAYLRSKSLLLTSLAMALAEGAPALMALIGTAALDALLPGADAQRTAGGTPEDFDATIPAIS